MINTHDPMVRLVLLVAKWSHTGETTYMEIKKKKHVYLQEMSYVNYFDNKQMLSSTHLNKMLKAEDVLGLVFQQSNN